MRFRVSLERYNQLVWALIGSGLLIMLAVATIDWAVTSWRRSIRQGVPVEVVHDGSGDGPAVAGMQPGLKIGLCLPMEIEGTPYQLIRVGMDRIVVRGRVLKAEGGASMSGSGSGSYEQDAGLVGGCGDAARTTGNVMIRDKRSGAMRLLLSQSAVIRSVELPVRKRRAQDDPGTATPFPPAGTVYWEIGHIDSNGDGMLDEEDDIGAYLSDVDGSRLVRVTPPGSRVLDKSYDETRRILTVRIVTDTNGDKTLDADDAVSVVEINVPERRIVGTIADSASWQQRAAGLGAANALP